MRRLVRRLGQIRASIGIGWPGETEAEIEATLTLVNSVPGLAFDAFRYLPLPGVPLTTYWSRRDPSGTRALDYVPTSDYSEYGGQFLRSRRHDVRASVAGASQP